MQELDVNSTVEVIKKRNESFNMQSERKYQKEEHIIKSLKLLESIKRTNGGTEFQKISNEITKNGDTELDVSYYLGKYTTKIINENFSTFAIPLYDGTLITHNEVFDSKIITNIDKFKGTIVLDGLFNICSAYVFDDNGNNILERYINTSPADQNIEIISIPGQNDISEELKDSNKNTVELRLKGLKLSNNGKYKKIFKDADIIVENTEQFGRNIPKFLPSEIKQKLIQLKVNRYKQQNVKFMIESQMAIEHIYNMFELSDLL